ncbi:MAG: flagellar hook-length control protein FliK [Pseudomonadota bacterium]
MRTALPALPALAATTAAPKAAPGMGAPNDTGPGEQGFASELQKARAPNKAAPPMPTPPAPGNRSEEPAANADGVPAESEPAAAEVELHDDEGRAPALADLLPGWPSAAAPGGAVARLPTPTSEADGTDADACSLDGVAGRHVALSRTGRAPASGVSDPVPGALPGTAVGAPAGTESRHAAPGHEAIAAAAATKAGAESPPPSTPSALPLPAVPTLLAAAQPGPASAAVHEARIAVPLDSAAFAPALATQVTWLVQEGVQHARLSLNPAEMGPLAVRIVLDGTQARIDFSADVAGTRDAIEASLPALAAALHDSGLTLSGGGVSDGRARDGAHAHRHDPLPAPGRPGSDGDGGNHADAGGRTLPARAARGLVDLVA